jgi:4-hydroxybenzoate polyprenyltransferase
VVARNGFSRRDATGKCESGPQDFGMMRDALRDIQQWGEMIKFSHSIFALPFALVAAVLAGHMSGGGPGWDQILLIVGCMVCARSFAMTANRCIDAELDACNPRTAKRAIPAGDISLRAAWAFAAAAATGFVLCCVGFWWHRDNPWPTILAIPLLGFLAGYSYSKRFTSLAHFWLGCAIASAPVAAWIAIDPRGVGVAAVALMVAAATWIAGFDIIYSCQDADFDRRAGLHSLPSRIGVAASLWVSRACHVVTVAVLALLPLTAPLGGWYVAGVVCVALLLVFEQSLVRAGDLSRVNLAFFTINGVVSLVFAAASIADVVL